MSINLSERTADFFLPIPDSAHKAAALESQSYSMESLKAEQAYLSHLASYAVRYYLNLCGYPTPTSAQKTLDFVGRALSDSTTVEVSGYGPMACIIVPEGTVEIDIPIIALQAPIGYVAVAFNDALGEAAIVGFLPQTHQASVARSELRLLLDLPGYLAQINPVATAAVQLSRWWERSFETGWTLISELASDRGSEPTLSFRGGSALTNLSGHSSQSNAEGATADLEDGLVCQKTVSLTNAEQETFRLSLMMERFAKASQRINLVARLSPNLGQAYLPEDIELAATDETHTVFSSVRSRAGSAFVELRFSADAGDYFSLEVAFDDISIHESFVV